MGPPRIEILELYELKDCFDGTFSRELKLNLPITRQIIERLLSVHEGVFLKDLPRPFYRIQVHNQYVVKGFENDTIVEVNCRDAGNVEKLRQLIRVIEETIG